MDLGTMPDAHELFPALATALQFYAKTLPSPVTKTKFELVPDGRLVEPKWIARAVLTGHDLKVPEPKSVETEYLEGAETVQVAVLQWEATADTFPEAIEGLVAEVQKDLTHRMSQRHHELAAAESAVRALQNPTELKDLWPTRDPDDEVDVEDG